MKKTIVFIMATGALILLAWQNYIDPFLQILVTLVANKQVLDATRVQHKINTYVEPTDHPDYGGYEDL